MSKEILTDIIELIESIKNYVHMNESSDINIHLSILEIKEKISKLKDN